MQALQSLANRTKKQTDWHSIDWKKANRIVRNLRQRIFRATQEHNFKKVRSLQKLMLRSLSNRQVAVRRVTQINQGKHTPGIDKVVVKTPAARANLVDDLVDYQLWKAKPVRRVYIPKANGKSRPLGIPVIRDRAIQAMVKNALEPAWEARFEKSSYGFRPGRGCHDAIEKIFGIVRPKASQNKKWVLDADIKGAFDNISIEFLLETIGNVPGIELIKQWLKAGYIEKDVFHQTEAGTPQGGVISPLLANIALHGMEEALGVKYGRGGSLRSKRAVVKYADDFCVFCESQEDAEEAKEILGDWLKTRGLSLSPEKTQIVHVTQGFNFLGFNIRHYRSTKTKTGWKLLTKPSKQSVQKHRQRLRQEWQALVGRSLKEVIVKLNPIIRGWANYFRTGVARKVFEELDYWMYYREVRYVKRAHSAKPKYWWKAKYFGKLNLERNDKWVFGDKQSGHHLIKHSWFPIERHILVKGAASPDDPRLRQYWLKRSAVKAKDLTPSKQKLSQRQKGRCLVCGESLFNDELLEVHHKLPKGKGGASNYSNLELIHLNCHQQLTYGAG